MELKKAKLSSALKPKFKGKRTGLKSVNLSALNSKILSPLTLSVKESKTKARVFRNLKIFQNLKFEKAVKNLKARLNLSLNILNQSAAGSIRFYQRFLSVLKPRCCRFYPSCSQYALIQFKKNNAFKAFFSTILRLLRCNAYFKGGFDYASISQKRLFKGLNLRASKDIEIKYFYVPKGAKYQIIEKFKGLE